MVARNRSLVKFYIRAREPMDAEVSAALDSFAAENRCDRSGAARHLILLGKRHWRDCGLQTNTDSIQRCRVFPTEISEAVLGRQPDSVSNAQSCSEIEIAAGTGAPSPSMVSAAHAPGYPPTSSGHVPIRMGSPDVASPKRLNAAKLKFRSKSPNEAA
jgi:hypothetical protein